MPGRPRKPTAVLKALGSKHAKGRGKEPQFEQATCECPVWLPREAKAEWKRVVPQLDKVGLLTGVDRSVLVAYCRAWQDLYLASKALTKEGIFQIDRNGIKRRHPAIDIVRGASDQVNRFAQQFGLTPSSRARLEVPDKKDDDKGDFFKAAG